MKKKPFEKLTIGLVATMIILLISLALSFTLSVRLKDSIKHAEILNEVIHEMDKVLYYLSFCESNLRGYLLTREEQFLSEYEGNKNILRNKLYSLNHVQYDKEINHFCNLLEERVKIMDEKAFLIQNASTKPAELKTLVNKGRVVTDSIINYKNYVESNEMQLLNQRNSEVTQYLFYAKYMSLISVLISIVIGAFILFLSRKHLKEKQKKVVELEELDKNKNKFFSLISHDLRSPVGRLLHLSKMISNSYYSVEQKDLGQMINMNLVAAGKLMTLVDNLLVWSKSQMQRIEVNADEVKLSEAVDQAISLIDDYARTKNVTIINRTDNNINVHVDLNMLVTVIRNLVHNAIKYSKQYSEVVITSVCKLNYAHITIRDNGIGMSPDKVGQLLQLENIVSIPGTAKEEGSGLGLILCKEFIEKNNGTIKIDSQKGKGTSVTITVPLFNYETIHKVEEASLAYTINQ